MGRRSRRPARDRLLLWGVTASSAGVPRLDPVAIRELTDGTRCDLVLLVRSVERRPRKDGRDFLKVVFGDRTGSLPTNVWDEVDDIERALQVGSAVRVRGKFEQHEKYGAQLRFEGVEAAVEGSYDPTELRAGPPVPVAELERRLRALIASVEEPGMALLLDAVLGEGTATWEAYRVAPAAKRVHQAYRHGLLEHCLTVAEAVAGAAAVFPGIDRDLAVAAALVHDLGKLDAYAFTGEDVVELTDAGKLRGEIVLGYERLHRVLDDIDLVDETRTQAFLHIILSHHGHLEHGSPVVPQTREAFLVHMMDNLGGKLGIVDRLEQERAPGSAWSGFDRAFGGSVWFPELAEAGAGGTGGDAAAQDPGHAYAPPSPAPPPAFSPPPLPPPDQAGPPSGTQPLPF